MFLTGRQTDEHYRKHNQFVGNNNDSISDSSNDNNDGLDHSID